MLWLYDSRDSLHGRRKLHILPLTGAGKAKAWEIVLAAELPPDEREDYQYLAEGDAENEDAQNCELFNDYWAEFGWYLMAVEPDAEVPSDAEIVDTPESATPNKEGEQ